MHPSPVTGLRPLLLRKLNRDTERADIGGERAEDKVDADEESVDSGDIWLQWIDLIDATTFAVDALQWGSAIWAAHTAPGKRLV